MFFFKKKLRKEFDFLTNEFGLVEIYEPKNFDKTSLKNGVAYTNGFYEILILHDIREVNFSVNIFYSGKIFSGEIYGLNFFSLEQYLKFNQFIPNDFNVSHITNEDELQFLIKFQARFLKYCFRGINELGFPI